MKTLILAILTLSLFGCSSKQGSSSAGIQVFAGKLAISSASGGAMIWGRDRSGNNSFGEKLVGPSFEIELPNGIWDFYVIAWEGPEAFQGIPHCAGALAVELKGGDVNVALQTANSKCGLAPFNAHTFNNGGTIEFPVVKLKTCNEKSQLTEVGCDTDFDEQGYVGSYNFVMPSYTKFAGDLKVSQTNSLINSCSVVTLESMKMVANFGNLPLFGPNLPFLSVIRSHLGTDDCNEYGTGSGHIDVMLNSGLPISQVPKLVNNVSGSGPFMATFAHQLTESDVCQGSRLTTSPSEPFAGGNGTAEQPKLICTKAQLSKMNDDWTPNSGMSYWLLRDLTLDRLAIPTFSLGDTYPGTVSSPFSGTFNGRGHSISNYYLNLDSVGYTDDVGFIRSLSGTVKNLKFLNAEVICDDDVTECNNVGILVGKSTGSVENVTVTGRVVGRSIVGGIIGDALSGTGYSYLHAKVQVEAKSSYCGGLIGRSSVSLSNSSSEVEIYSEQNYVGGLVGDQFSGSISFSTSKGTVAGESIVGGLAGNLANTTSITHSYSTANVHATNSMSGASISLGGLVGYCNGVITNSFHTEGSITTERNNSNDEYMAAVGGLVGETGGSGSATGSFFTGHNNEVAMQFGVALAAGKGIGTHIAIGNSAGQLYDATTFAAAWGTMWDGVDPVVISDWTMPDAGYDYPRLSWEILDADRIPAYLKRECSGKFASNYGAGTQADPRWICTKAQFEAMNASLHYILKRNIDYGNASKAGKIFVPGIYKLNGNGNSLNSIWILPMVSGYNAIFQDLQTGSYVKNLKIIGSKVHVSSYGNPSDQASMALLAGINSGLIENIVVDRSKIQVDSLDTSGTITDLWISGLVTRNFGTIRKVRTYIDIDLQNIDLTANAGDRLWASGLVHQNDGTISIVKADNFISLISTFAGADPNITQYKISGLFSHNNNLISEVQAYVGSSLTGMTSGGATLAGLINTNTGTIRDVSLEASFRHNSAATTSEIAGVVASNATGTIQRLINLGSDGDSDYSYGFTDLDSFSLLSSGTFTSVFCLADNETAYGGFPNGNNVIDCLDLNNLDPEFTVTQNSASGITVNYQTDVPSTGTINLTGFSFTTNPNDTSATWLLNGDEAPEIRSTRFVGNF